MAEGRVLIECVGRRSRLGSYAVEGVIAAVHADASSAEATDWPQIVAIYERLYALHPTPIVALNHAVAVSMPDGPDAALPLVYALSEPLAAYHLWHAARADVLRRMGHADAALASYH